MPAAMAALCFACALCASGCAFFHRPGEDVAPLHTRIFLTDYNTAWQAVLDATRSYERTVVNREAGVVQTSWIDNLARGSFTDPYVAAGNAFKAKYRLSFSLAPGNYHGRPSVKVSVQKEQQVQQDLLDDWRPAKTDSIEERTLLYRIGRFVRVQHRLKKIEEEKARRVLEEGA